MKNVLTQKNLIDAGVQHLTTKWHRGYVSRRSSPEDRPVIINNRLKTASVLAPSWDSSNYCHRMYYDYAGVMALLTTLD